MPDQPSQNVPNLWRTLAIVAGGIAFLWITVAASFAQVASHNSPATVLKIWPFSVEARTQMAAARLTADPSPTTAAFVFAQTRRALIRGPLNVTASYIAGLATARMGNDGKARRLIGYAEHLSRHDLGTQTALIEFAVADGDVPLALHHYDIALRSGDAADQLLMPVLVDAARKPQVATALRPILAARPPWRMRFIYSVLVATPWSATFMPLMTAAKLDVNEPLERDFLTRATKGLVANGTVGDAARLYALATGTPVVSGVRNGSFVSEDRIAPFDWEIAEEPGLGAIKGPVDGTALPGALSLDAAAGRSGVVAKQLLLLQPGRHHLRFTVGNVSAADRSSVALTCGSGFSLASIRLPAIDTSRTIQVMFNVPPECLAQWLTVQAGTDIDALAGNPVPWISGIAVSS